MTDRRYHSGRAGLTPIERTIVSLYVGGATADQIASWLYYSRWTVLEQLKRVRRKIGGYGDKTLLAEALEQAYSKPPEPVARRG